MSTKEDQMGTEEGSSPFASVIVELEQFIFQQAIAEQDLRRQLVAHQNETRKAARALEILKDRKANQERKASPKAPAKNRWIPSKGKIDAVLAAVTDTPQTVTQITRASGVSSETVRKAIDYLRQQEQIRMTGMTNAGNSHQKVKAYALMPTATPEMTPNGTH